MSFRPVGVLSYPPPMPWGIKRYEQAHCLHFVAFSCYHRAPLLASPDARRIFEQTLEQVRLWYGFYLTGYVVPEHVHLLLSEQNTQCYLRGFRC
jgi:putative transposase